MKNRLRKSTCGALLFVLLNEEKRLSPRQRIFHNSSQSVDKQRRGVERFGTGKLDAVFFRLLASAYLDIIEDLQVIGQELDRGDQYMGVSRLFEFRHQIGKIRSQPLLFRMSRALIAELPAIRREASQLRYC